MIGKYGLKHPEYSGGFLRGLGGRVLGDMQTMGTAGHRSYSNLTHGYRRAVQGSEPMPKMLPDCSQMGVELATKPR